MEALLVLDVWLQAGLIFVLRVANMALDTLRVMMVIRNRRWVAWWTGFVETILYVVVLSSVLQGLDNWLNIIAYSAGFATGNVVGMWVETKLAIGFISVQIISPALGTAIAEKLREAGYAVTEVPARGRDGMVTMLNVLIARKYREDVRKRVQAIDDEAMLVSTETNRMWRGYWRIR